MSLRDDLLTLLRQHAVLHGDFVLASGQRSSYYLDARLVTLSAVGSRLVGRLMYDYLAADPPDAVGGMSLGADPIVTAITVTSALEGRAIDGLLVRKTAKTHGVHRRVEGPLRPSMRVVVVEDTVTTGNSPLAAVEAIRAEGGHVEHVLALIDREQGATERLRAEGLHFHAFYTAREILGEERQG
jgi:orotate phosphoribosyltransferase